MAKSREIPFECDTFYHIYNRGNNRDKIFFSEENYAYFLSLFNKYFSDLLNVYAFCLLPNHFHFLVQVKGNHTNAIAQMNATDAIALSDGICKTALSDGICKTFSSDGLLNPRSSEYLNKTIIEQFRRFFISYSQAINKQEGRVGSLFQKPFKRKEVESKQHLKNLVVYIHTNPSLHGFSNSFSNYKHSSFKTFFSNDSMLNIEKEEVLAWFTDKENFLYCHNQRVTISTDLSLE